MGADDDDMLGSQDYNLNYRDSEAIYVSYDPVTRRSLDS